MQKNKNIKNVNEYIKQVNICKVKIYKVMSNRNGNMEENKQNKEKNIKIQNCVSKNDPLDHFY